jgi:hypothetical protein
LYLVIVFPFLCTSSTSLYQTSQHFPSDIYGSRFSDSCQFTTDYVFAFSLPDYLPGFQVTTHVPTDYVLVFSLPDCFSDLPMLSLVPTYPLGKENLPNVSTQTPAT